MPQAHSTPLQRSSPAFFASRIPLPRTTMDIDDILASVDRGAGASTESTAIDHQLLTRFWVAERAVSEVLPWPAPLMERMMDRVRLQVRIKINRDPALQYNRNYHFHINFTLRMSNWREEKLISLLYRSKQSKTSPPPPQTQTSPQNNTLTTQI